MKKEMVIKPLIAERIDNFFVYLNDHISDNGKNNAPLFLPISRDNLNIPMELTTSFSNGLSTSIGTHGWRRVLIAVNNKDEIIGHIDLKSHNQNNTQHRAVMGMGVDRDNRKKGLGNLLIESIIAWAKNETSIEYIDLWVLSENNAAIRLYKRLGFKKIGEVEDMFRIDNNSHNYIMMAKKIV